jgi:lantibiotic modifying enzyme
MVELQKAVVEEAVARIAEVLRGHARTARDGAVYWCHPAQSTGLAQPAPLGPHLFAGTLGCALFFVALARVSAKDDDRELARRALSPLRGEIHAVVGDPARARRVRQPLGGLSGLGSLVYGLVRIGDLLEDPSLCAEAHLASALLTADRIDSGESLDVMTGSAGALLALLALDQRRPEANLNGATPLELASACAHHLLRSHPILLASGEDGDPARPPFWRGFSHGTAGICTALLRLYARTGQPELWSAVHRIFAAERRVDPDSGAEAPNSWCKGAPGIALGRIEALDLSTDRLLDGEAAAALAVTSAPTLEASDDLCCGNAGRLDTLVQASRKRAEPARLHQAFELAGRVLERAERNGRYAQRLAPEYGLDLRFFPGLAGIGYSLLRLLVPELPCVAALE